MSEILIYAVMAAVLCVMLFKVLGKQVGEPPETPLMGPDATPAEREEAPIEARRSRHFDGDAGEGLAAIANADPTFDPDTFIDGAKTAYGMILEGYADGDKETLAMLLSPEMNEAYVAAIDDRDARRVTQTTDLARLIRADFISASQDGKTSSVTVEYEAEIAAAILNAEGDVIEGDPDRLARVTELWSYTREAGNMSANWALISVEESGEDTLGSAPDFTPGQDD